MMFSKKKLMRDLAITNYIMQKYDVSFTISLADISPGIEMDNLNIFEEFEEGF